MLKRRTRITAWAFGVLMFGGLIGVARMNDTWAARGIVLAFGVVITTMWFALLWRRVWAWWSLVCFLVLDLVCIAHTAAVDASGASDTHPLWVRMAVVTLVSTGWPLAVLLTDCPKRWRMRARVAAPPEPTPTDAVH